MPQSGGIFKISPKSWLSEPKSGVLFKVAFYLLGYGIIYCIRIVWSWDFLDTIFHTMRGLAVCFSKPIFFLYKTGERPTCASNDIIPPYQSWTISCYVMQFLLRWNLSYITQNFYTRNINLVYKNLMFFCKYYNGFQFYIGIYSNSWNNIVSWAKTWNLCTIEEC